MNNPGPTCSAIFGLEVWDEEHLTRRVSNFSLYLPKTKNGLNELPARSCGKFL